MPIRILSDETIDQIAAGEVVERPANVVKELVENSLDAQSTEVGIEILGAGRRLIRVRDNGTGMSREDLTLAVTRHATSKIASLSDLDTLATLGFRGEALPSIASVSRLLLQSQPRGGTSGWELRMTGGTFRESRAWAGTSGTNIEVSDLFYNTPARAKFLKSDPTEREHIIGLIEENAIARPDVSFHAASEGKTVIRAPRAATLPERLTDILGKDFTGKLVAVEAEHPYLAVKGYVTRTEHSMPGRGHQYLFVNGRPVRLGRSVTHALYEAYREHLPAGRHPGAVLFISVSPSEVDVNIHPTKREVRFSREREFHDLLYRVIKTALNRPLAVTFPDRPGAPAAVAGPSLEESARVFSGESVIPEPPSPHPVQAELPGGLETEHGGRVLGQALGLYVVVQEGDELLVIDQHAAAERVRYERYVGEWQRKEIPVQGLLLPVTLELPASRAGTLRENLPFLRETGWEIEEFGGSTFRVTALPAILGTDIEVTGLLDAILAAVTEGTKLPPLEKLEHIIRAACRTSIKARDILTREEMQRLVRDLYRCRAPFTCPHGRPTVLKLSRHELEKHFGRK